MENLLAGGLWLVAVGLVVAGIVVVIGIAAASRGIKTRREDPTTNPVDIDSDHGRSGNV